ncbi:MAG: peptidase MA domain-containing protein [Dehalococcoidia bacterium]|nr:peptidase MA domain-containing protein [Dehalococcoidia bacterium]
MVKKKKNLLLILILLVLSLIAVPSPCVAQGQITVISSDAEVNFPDAITFRLEVNSNADITDIRLRYQIDKITTVRVFAEVVPEFTSSPALEVEWTREMRKTGSLPPGAEISFWWLIKDADGGELETARSVVKFDDARYSWEELVCGEVSLFWYEGNQSFAQELMNAAHKALEKLSEDTGAFLDRPVKIYIYADASDLQDSLIFPQEWTGGVAFVEYGIVAIGISPGNLNWGKSTIAHELAHLATYQMTFNPYAGIPLWLNEGLSMYAQGEIDSSILSALNRAIDDNKLISVRSLRSSFPTDLQSAYLSYGQSYSLVEFLIETYGRDYMNQLLSVFKQGNSDDFALESVYGFDTDGLDSRWRNAVGARSVTVSLSCGLEEQLVPVLV